MPPSDKPSDKIPTRAAKKTAQRKSRHELGPLPDERVWLVSGEYSTTRDRPRLVARWLLIEAAVRKVPNFLESLSHNVYPKFARLSPPDVRIRHFEQLKDKPALRDALLGWAARFHITEKDTWLLDGALRCLDRWHRSQEDRAALDHKAFKPQLVESGLVTPDWPAFALIPFEFKDPGWDLLWTSFAGWLKLMLKSVESEARAYGKKMRKSAKVSRRSRVHQDAGPRLSGAFRMARAVLVSW